MKNKVLIHSVAITFMLASVISPSYVIAQEEATTNSVTSLSTETVTQTTITEESSEAVSADTSSEAPIITSEETTEELTAVEEKAVNPLAIYRLYNPSTGKHLYTTDENEKNVLYNQRGWGYEGVGWYSPSTGIPVYRIYNPVLQNHLYTQDEHEVRVLTSQHGWKSDNGGNPVFYSGGSVNVYRLYNRGLQGRHHWTTDINEYKVLPSHGWSQEDIKFKALKVGSPIQTQYKENIPSGTSTIVNTPSKMTIEADVVLTGSGTGYHAKLVMVTPTSGISFGIQYDAHARAPHTGKASFMVENITHNNAGGQSYHWTNHYARSGMTYRLMLILQNDGSYAGYINGAKVISGHNPALANRSDVYLRIEGAARKTGDTINANFTNIKLKQNGYYDRNKKWIGTPRFNPNNGLITKLNSQPVPNNPSGDQVLTGQINISGRLTGLPPYADWDTAGYFDKVSGLIQFY